MPNSEHPIVPQALRSRLAQAKPSTNGHSKQPKGDGANEIPDNTEDELQGRAWSWPKHSELLKVARRSCDELEERTIERVSVEAEPLTDVAGRTSTANAKGHTKDSVNLASPPGEPPVKQGLLAKYGEPLRQACERHAADEVTFSKEDVEADYLPNLRAFAVLLSHLQHDPAKLTEAMKTAGASPIPNFERWLREMANGFLQEADESQQSDDWLWNKYPARPTEDKKDDLPAPAVGLSTRRLSEVHQREIEWLWPHRIPIGYLSLVNGDPDLGKTWIILDILARITTGRGFPDGSVNPYVVASEGGSECARRDVLWVSAEDADEDVVKPRFLKLGGDPSRFHSVRCVTDRTGKRPTEQTLDLSRHLDALDEWLTAHKLVVAVAIDPLAAFLGKVDSHRNSDVRGLLTPLTKLAERHRVAVIGNNHLAKGDGDNAMYRGMGSIAFVAAARSSWLVTPDPDQPKDRRLFTRVKANLAGEDVGGLAYRVGPHVGGLLWEEGRVDATANEALRSTDSGTKAPARSEAEAWLRDLLADGPVPAADVWTQAEGDGMCKRTVKTAKSVLGVRTTKMGGTGAGWQWSLPKPKR